MISNTYTALRLFARRIKTEQRLEIASAQFGAKRCIFIDKSAIITNLGASVFSRFRLKKYSSIYEETAATDNHKYFRWRQTSSNFNSWLRAAPNQVMKQ